MEGHYPGKGEKVSKGVEKQPETCFFCKGELKKYIRKTGAYTVKGVTCSTEGCKNNNFKLYKK